MFAGQGRIEARIKLASGQGLWPAFWMLGKNIGAVGWRPAASSTSWKTTAAM